MLNFTFGEEPPCARPPGEQKAGRGRGLGSEEKELLAARGISYTLVHVFSLVLTATPRHRGDLFSGSQGTKDEPAAGYKLLGLVEAGFEPTKSGSKAPVLDHCTLHNGYWVSDGPRHGQ